MIIIVCQIQSVWFFWIFFGLLRIYELYLELSSSFDDRWHQCKMSPLYSNQWSTYNFQIQFYLMIHCNSQIFLIYLLCKGGFSQKMCFKNQMLVIFYLLCSSQQKINQKMCCGIFFLCKKSTLGWLCKNCAPKVR